MIRLREEIASVMGDSAHPTKEQIRKMPYLSCVIKESKYSFPSIPSPVTKEVRSSSLPPPPPPRVHLITVKPFGQRFYLLVVALTQIVPY